jgi:hypothetical protein
MLISYRSVFNGGLSSDSSNWGDFGDYFGSITGLIAFLGILFTIRESRRQAKASEERGIFFKMLELYQKQVDTLTFSANKGLKAFENYANEIENKTIMYFIYYGINNDKNFKLNDGDSLIYDAQLKVAKDLEVNIENQNKKDIATYMKAQVLLRSPSILVPNDFEVKKGAYDMYIRYMLNNGKYDNLSFNDMYPIIREIADNIYISNGCYIGQYIRNIYYLLEIISNTKDEKQYSRIFRAQLSKNELIVLLYNSVSGQSTKKAVRYLMKNHIFNNILSNDVYLLKNKEIFKQSNKPIDGNILTSIDMLNAGIHVEKNNKEYDSHIIVDILLKNYLNDPINVI